MKNTLFLFLACIATAAASAQAISDRTISGKWEIATFNAYDIFWDLKTDEVRPPSYITETMEAEDITPVIAEIKEGLKNLKGSYIKFGPDKKYEHLLMGEPGTGTYGLVSENGKHYFDATVDGMTDRLEVVMIKEQMQVSIPDDEGGEIVMLFNKVK
jgi:hypothetical protein